ncbi:MAG: hypothetical protein ACOCP8_08240 [archaeon]
MIRLREIKLKNYCGYKDFKKEFDINNPWIIMYGPNGIGKSNLLNAIEILSHPWKYRHRLNDIFFRRLTYNKDYNPNYEGFHNNMNNLYMEAIFMVNNEEKQVIIKNFWKKIKQYSSIYEREVDTIVQDEKKSGIIKDELTENVSNYINADNQIDTQKFQLKASYKDKFLEMAKIIYGFDCYFPDYAFVKEKAGNENLGFYTDFILQKFGTKVHFKKFSAGEKKIATMLRKLFNDIYDYDLKNILLIDNIAMHVYYNRHLKMLEKIHEFFPDNQIITTTHSPEIIKNTSKKFLIDMKKELEK